MNKGYTPDRQATKGRSRHPAPLEAAKVATLPLNFGCINAPTHRSRWFHPLPVPVLAPPCRTTSRRSTRSPMIFYQLQNELGRF